MTDQEICQALHSLLHYYSSSSSSQSSNPNSPSPAAPFTSITSVVQYLETKLGVDLSHKADFIRSQLQQFLFQPQAPPQPPPPPLHHQHLQHHHHQVHPYQQQQQQQHLQHHHQLQHHPHPHPHLQIQTHQPSSFQPKDHYALQQSPNFHPVHSPSFFSSPFPPGGLSFQSVPTHHVKSDPSILSNSTLPGSDPAKASGPSKGKRRGGAGGLNKLCGVSPQLEAVVGHPALPRTEIVRQLWAYIRKNNLQDPSNKRKIICNDALRLVFETDCTDMFKMNKLLSKHILPLDPTKEASAKKQKVADEDKESSDMTRTVSSGMTQSVPDQSPPSPSPAPTSAIAPDLPPVPAPSSAPTPAPAPSVGISDELANFFGVGVREMLQSEVFTRVAEYINSNNLEDPVNPTVVVCDSKLQELFGCQSFPASKIMEVLSRQHIFRA
ncbi:Upstream activation factor subunit spp27 [Linum grandiflorum]